MNTSFLAALSSVVVRCDSSVPTVHDQLFDVHIPKHISVKGTQKQDLFATAHRCMNNWCFLKPARAYVLGLFVDHGALNRLKTMSPDNARVSREDVFKTDCPKSFVLYFSSSKDIKHIRRGFTRSFETFIKDKPHLQLSMITHFLTVLDKRERLQKGDFIRVSCNPSSKSLTVSLNDETELTLTDAAGLIDWIHSLYVGLESNPVARYVSMQQKLRLANPDSSD